MHIKIVVVFSSFLGFVVCRSKAASQLEAVDYDHPIAQSRFVRDTPVKSGKKSLLCYYNCQAMDRDEGGKLLPGKIDPFLCTHIIYSYADITVENTLTLPYGLDPLKSLKELKGKNFNLKILIAVGGPDVVQYGEMVSKEKFRSKFIENMTNFLIGTEIDGVSLDWEWPGDGPEDKENFIKLLLEMRESFKPHGYLMMSAVSSNKTIIDAGYQVDELHENLDFISIRAFGFRKKNSNTAPHSALYHSDNFDLREDDLMRNVNWSVNYWLQKGAPAEKLILGVPFYGIVYQLQQKKSNRFNELTSIPSGGGPYTQLAGLLAYNEICVYLKRKNFWTVIRDQDYRTPYAVDGKRWLTYDDSESLKQKASYVKTMKLGGISIMSLDYDDFRATCHPDTFALTRAIGSKLGLDYHPTSAPNDARSTTNKPKIDIATERVTDSSSITSPPETATAITTSFKRPKNIPTCGDGGNWYFPGPTCRQYYDCTSGDPILQTCREDLIWKQSKLWCDLQRHVPECKD